MIKCLQQDAIHSGILISGKRCVSSGKLSNGKDRQQAIAEMIDRGVGEDPLQVFLGKRGVSGKYNGRHRHPQEWSQDNLHLRTEDGQQNSKKSVDSHFRHRAGEQNSSSSRRFTVG